MNRACKSLLVATAFVATSCGGAQPPANQKSAAQVLGEHTCKIIPNRLKPLAVDWPQSERVDLEAMLREHRVLVVAYDCRSLKVLPDCRLAGQYGYVGVTTKETVETLSGESEIAVNLPFNGMGVAAKLGASASESASLVVAMSTVGVRKTTRSTASRAELEGTCDEATHFVRGVKVGAFAITRGEASQHGTAASVFGLGADAKSTAEHRSSISDGSLEACGSADINASSPPSGCGAPLQLDLVALEAGIEAPVACAEGLVWTGDKCAADKSAPRPCEAGNAAECRSQCDRGNAESCHELAKMISGGQVAGKDGTNAFSLFQKNCEAGWQPSCNNVGVAYATGVGTEKNALKAVRAYQDACESGFETSCVNLGAMYFEGADVPKNTSLATTMFYRACEAGEPNDLRRCRPPGDSEGRYAEGAQRRTEIGAGVVRPRIARRELDASLGRSSSCQLERPSSPRGRIEDGRV
ncbi:MAG: tetratricopeptide repeat protein, partial [Myxococcota bacterium]